MHIPRYWVRATINAQGQADETGDFIGVGWSDVSEADAYQVALQRAQRILERYNRGDEPDRENYYADRPLRELIVDELHEGDQRLAVVTRNVYGSFVLNAANAMFIDIDLPQQKKQVGLIGRLFGKKAEAQPSAEEQALERIARAAERHPGLDVRWYRTAAGFRGIITSQPFDPTDAQTLSLLESFGSDELYVRLCKAQACFRARLSPKPWRMGLDLPPRGYPWADDERKLAFDRWSASYDRAGTQYAVCQPMEGFSGKKVHPAIAPILEMHDKLTCGEGKPLA